MNSFARLKSYNKKIMNAYAIFGLKLTSEQFFRTEQGVGPQLNKYLTELVAAIRARVSVLGDDVTEQFLSESRLRRIRAGNIIIDIPILTQQGAEWYGESSIYNFDFLYETNEGLHADMEVVYDFGAHHGVWSAYYANLLSSPSGRIYAFEASLLNYEISALLFLLNGIDNVISYPLAISSSFGRSDGLLVDFVDHPMHFFDVNVLLCDPPDFIKIDIEGFEYDLLIARPEILASCSSIHLELHIPHLEQRGLNYRDVMALLPFETANIVDVQGGGYRVIDANDELAGFCSLLISSRDPLPSI